MDNGARLKPSAAAEHSQEGAGPGPRGSEEGVLDAELPEQPAEKGVDHTAPAPGGALKGRGVSLQGNAGVTQGPPRPARCPLQAPPQPRGGPILGAGCVRPGASGPGLWRPVGPPCRLLPPPPRKHRSKAPFPKCPCPLWLQFQGTRLQAAAQIPSPGWDPAGVCLHDHPSHPTTVPPSSVEGRGDFHLQSACRLLGIT